MGFSHCPSEEKGIYWVLGECDGREREKEREREREGNIIKMDCNTNAMQDLTELTA